MPEASPKNDPPLINEIAGFLPFENDLLVRSELLIEKQREHIKDLKERLREFEKSRQSEYAEKLQEVRALQESNAKLRLEIDLLRGELSVRDESINLAESTGRQWKDEVTALSQKLAEAEAKIRELDLDAQSKLISDRKSNDRNVLGSKHGLASDSAAAEARLKDLKTEILDAEAILLSLRNKIEETRIAVSCMANAEYELVECREIIRDQKNKLACLQRLVDAANKEKQIIPPTLLVDAHAFMETGRTKIEVQRQSENTSAPNNQDSIQTSEIRNLQNMIQALSSKLTAEDNTANVTMHLLTVFKDLQATIKDRLVHETKSQVAEVGGDFVSLNVSHLKLMVSPTDIPVTGGNALLDFARDYVDRTRKLSEALFHERVINIGTKYFTITEDGSSNIILHKYHQWDCKAVWDELEGWIVLRCLPAGDSNAAECHILNFGGPDQYLRGFHALQYTGIIPPGQQPLEYVDAEKSKSQFTAVLGDSSKIHDGRTTSPNLSFQTTPNGLKISNPSDTTLSEINPADCIVQCDSQNQCVKMWVPEAQARRIFGATPQNNANGLTQINCVFNDPSSGYSKFLSDISSLRWKDVILSAEAQPAIIKQALQAAEPRNKTQQKMPEVETVPARMGSPMATKPSSPQLAPAVSLAPGSMPVVMPPPVAATVAPATTTAAMAPAPVAPAAVAPAAAALAFMTPAPASPAAVAPVAAASPLGSPAVSPAAVALAAPAAPPKTPVELAKETPEKDAKTRSNGSDSGSGGSLQDLEDSLANLDDSEFEQLIVTPGLLKIMADKSHVLTELEASKYHVRFNDANAEIEVVQLDPKTQKTLDQYTFNFPDKTTYESKRTSLLENGFKEAAAVTKRSRESKTTQDPNVAIVQVQKLKLRGVEIDATRAEVKTDPKRREISIVEQLSNGRTRKVRLDCTVNNYKNWLRALTWAQFRMNGKPPVQNKGGTKLKEFRFVIHAPSDDGVVEKLARMTSNGELALYAPGDKDPKFTLTKVNSEIVMEQESRMFRCKVNPRSPHELWLEITFPILKDFDEIEAGLNSAGLIKGKDKFVLGEFVEQTSPVISVRRGIMQIWQTAAEFNSDKKPILILTTALVDATSAKHGEIMLVPKGVVDKRFAENRSVLKGFILELSSHPEEFEALRFGLIHGEFWQASAAHTSKAERQLQPQAALTIMYHGTTSYMLDKKRESFTGHRVNTGALSKISTACLSARQTELALLAKKGSPVISKIKAGPPTSKGAKSSSKTGGATSVMKVKKKR